MIMEIGRLTQDVVVNEVAGNKKVLNNRVAIRLGKDDTLFLDVVAWDKVAELIGKYFRKGYEICFEGRLIKQRKFVAKDVEVDMPAVEIERVRFTNGNPVEGSEAHSDDDFLK